MASGDRPSKPSISFSLFPASARSLPPPPRDSRRILSRDRSQQQHAYATTPSKLRLERSHPEYVDANKPRTDLDKKNSKKKTQAIVPLQPPVSEAAFPSLALGLGASGLTAAATFFV